MKLIKLLLFLPFCYGCIQHKSSQQSSSGKLGLDTAAKTYTAAQEDSSMNSAIKQARQTIGQFDLALNKNSSTCTGFAIKKKICNTG